MKTTFTLLAVSVILAMYAPSLLILAGSLVLIVFLHGQNEEKPDPRVKWNGEKNWNK